MQARIIFYLYSFASSKIVFLEECIRTIENHEITIRRRNEIVNRIAWHGIECNKKEKKISKGIQQGKKKS